MCCMVYYSWNRTRSSGSTRKQAGHYRSRIAKHLKKRKGAEQELGQRGKEDKLVYAKTTGVRMHLHNWGNGIDIKSKLPERIGSKWTLIERLTERGVVEMEGRPGGLQEARVGADGPVEMVVVRMGRQSDADAATAVTARPPAVHCHHVRCLCCCCCLCCQCCCWGVLAAGRSALFASARLGKRHERASPNPYWAHSAPPPPPSNVHVGTGVI
jgi:hypothetical protein